jgi:hypothetical protein
LNSALKVLSGLDIFPRGPKKKSQIFFDQCNGLTMVPGAIIKVKVVTFSANHLRNDLVQLTNQNKTITEATNTKFLGLEFNKYMNWKNHYENMLQIFDNISQIGSLRLLWTLTQYPRNKLLAGYSTVKHPTGSVDFGCDIL